MKNVTRRNFIAASIATAAASHLAGASSLFAADSVSPPMQPVDFSHVTITDNFWRSKQQKVATATLSACILQTEVKTPRIRNFEKVARKQGEPHEGIYYDDSDVYKALEAMAYSLKNYPNADLEKKADEWIDKIAAAQQPDGYLNTYFTLRGIDGRWTDMEKHEDYNAGHLIEAAVAYYRTTGKRKFLDVAIRLADHIDETFRIPNRHWVSGHEEIELALMKLYRVTNDDRYLKLASWYLDQRGHGYGKGAIWVRDRSPEYCQDNVPVKDARKIVGHAVRAMYLYSGTADVAAATGDAGYMTAMKAVWEDVVFRNMYLTGGIGSSGRNEGFSQDYDLPNAQAYCETCASVGMVLWNQRMNQLTGESQYIDVLERSLYNGALDGLSLSGDRFFYGNPLASRTGFRSGRSEWFGTACCPANIARLVASLGSYIYGVSDRDLWVNLFVSGSAQSQLGTTDVKLEAATNYPREGTYKLTLNPARPARFALRLRIPGWVGGTAVPGNLYEFTDKSPSKVAVLLNGKPVQYNQEKGYAVLDRTWNANDVVELRLPMTIRQVVARNEVEADRGRIALQRGPIVYCLEGTDNNGRAWNVVLPQNTTYALSQYKVLDEDVVAIQCQGRALAVKDDGLAVESKPQTLIAIPYYTWANRGNYEMQVWLPTKIDEVRINS